MAHNNHLAHLFASSSDRAALLSLLACTIPKDIALSIGTIELFIAHHLKIQRNDADIYELLRSKAQELRRASTGMRNFSNRSKNRASDLVDIMCQLSGKASPQSLVDVGCAEGSGVSPCLHS